ncbi:MAG: hypothetical protein JNM19_01970 [Chitinophagaceae bacterium]|nr:hypothetical protein [Chitinophagaceae bacterium]
MKKQFITRILKISLTIVLLIKMSISGHTQIVPVNEPREDLPKLFAAVPDSVPVNIEVLTSLFEKQNGNSITILANGSPFVEGTIMSQVTKFSNTIRTVTVKLSFTEKALLVFSRITLPSGNTSYRGHINGKQTGDCFELVNQNGRYYFSKQSINRLRLE